MAAATATAAGICLDISGVAPSWQQSHGFTIIAAVFFSVFFVLTLWREIELRLAARPNVQYDGLIPDKGPVTISYANGAKIMKIVKNGYFFRIALKNNARNPAGANSTAQEMTASVDVYADGRVIDKWLGRWPANGEAESYAEKFRVDRLDLPANNQQAILDIGLRYEGEQTWQGWDNWLFPGGERRPVLQPGSYVLGVTIAPANCAAKELWFELKVPSEPQSDDINQVVMTPIKKPAILR